MPHFDDYDLETSVALDDEVTFKDVSDNSNTGIGAGTTGKTKRTTMGAFGRAVTGTVNAVRDFGADPTSTDDSTAAIQAAMLSFGTLGGSVSGTGGTVELGPGQFLVSNTLIRPSNVTLAGDGPQATTILLVTGSDCDVIQASTYESADQAAILGVSASDIGNAFYGGIRDLTIHGDAFHTVVAGYHFAISHTTNPLTDSAPSDPDFDPRPIYENLILTGCTGDGYIHKGRSGAKLGDILSQYHNGLAYVPSFDTNFDTCLANNCGGGYYMNHFSGTGTGKSYNHGQGNTTRWAADTSYTAGKTVIYGTDTPAMYFCIADVSGATTPDSDPTHWTELTDATAPQAWGTGAYWDSGAGEQAWSSIDCQENSANNYVFHNCSGVSINGASANPNYPNDGTNPNNYCHVVFDGCAGVIAQLAATGSNGAAYIYGSGAGEAEGNMLFVASDNSETGLKPDGTVPQTIFYNGVLEFPAGVVTSFFYLAGNQLQYNQLLSQETGGGTISQGSGAPPSTYSSGNSPVAGDIYFRTDTPTVANQRIYICTTGGGTPVWAAIQPSAAVLASTFTASATGTAAQNVTGMALALGVGTWKVRGYLPYQGASAAGSTHFGFTFSGTAGAGSIISWKTNLIATPFTAAPVTSTTITTVSQTSATLATSPGAFYEVTMTVVVTAAGTLQLQVYNGTTGDDTEVLAGASLEATQVA